MKFISVIGFKRSGAWHHIPYPEYFKMSIHDHLQSNRLRRQYTSTRVRTTYENISVCHHLQPQVTSPVMLLLRPLMTQNGVHVDSCIHKINKNHIRLSSVNRRDVKALYFPFWRDTLIIWDRCAVSYRRCH